jgi:hypothetical protein
MNKDNKINNETRVEKSTKVSQWRPSNLLEAPEARPGFSQRWIATMVLGQETPTNVAKRLREGWQPRDPKNSQGSSTFSNDRTWQIHWAYWNRRNGTL